MANDGNTTCAVPACGATISGPTNLCEKQRLSVMGVRVSGSTMVITAWYTEHGDEAGMILLIELALGQIFGGGAGFEAKLREQGFVNVGNLATTEELETAKIPALGKKAGDWAGPGARNIVEYQLNDFSVTGEEGKWRNNRRVFEDRVVPLEFLGTTEEADKIAAFALVHYDQIEIQCVPISDCVRRYRRAMTKGRRQRVAQRAPNKLVANVGNENGIGEVARSSVPSSGESSKSQGHPPVSKAARPLSEGASSPDSNNQDDDQ